MHHLHAKSQWTETLTIGWTIEAAGNRTCIITFGLSVLSHRRISAYFFHTVIHTPVRASLGRCFVSIGRFLRESTVFIWASPKIEFSRSLVLIQSCNRHEIRANVSKPSDENVCHANDSYKVKACRKESPSSGVIALKILTTKTHNYQQCGDEEIKSRSCPIDCQ